MKREIKFRAWTKKGVMQYNVVPFQWDYVIDRMWHKCIESNGAGILGSGGTEAKFEVGGYAIEENCLMQFTGLKDKNGKEIYEGDFLNTKTTFENNMADRRFQSHTIVQAGFEQGIFVDINTFVSLFEKIYSIVHHRVEYEVIGNIYENPELIK
jgi:uncharacterized phage protein (TIGR01671 family)